MNLHIPEDIVNAPVPAKTDSYSPVKHMDVVNAIQEMLDKKDITIKDANWWSNKGGNQMIGKFNLDFGGDPEMGGMLAFKNSYDKSMALGFAGGGNVFICANGVVNGEIVLIRRHTGSIVDEVNDKIVESIETLDVRFEELVSHREKMKEVELTPTQNAEMLGRMYFEEELLNSTQLNTVKRIWNNMAEYKEYDQFQEGNAWCTYNHITEALKKSQAFNYLENHQGVHDFFAKEFSLNS